MNISKILIITAVLLIIFLVACEPDTGPQVDVTKETKGLCFVGSSCKVPATNHLGYVTINDKESASNCCSFASLVSGQKQTQVSFCPEGKGLVRAGGFYAGCQQCVEIDCSTRTLTGPGVVQPTPKPVQPIVPQPSSVTQTPSDKDVVDYYCCVAPSDVFYPGPPYFKKVIDIKQNPRRCNPSFNTQEEATDNCSPKVAQVDFKVNNVNVVTDCESGQSMSYIVLSDPKKKLQRLILCIKLLNKNHGRV